MLSVGTHARLLKSFYQHFFVHDPCRSPMKTGLAMSERPCRIGPLDKVHGGLGATRWNHLWRFSHGQIRPSKARKQTMQSRMGCGGQVSSYYLGVCLIPATVIYAVGFRPRHCPGRRLALLSQYFPGWRTSIFFFRTQLPTLPLNSIFFLWQPKL